MKVAFIEPDAHLGDYDTDYHLILPTEITRSWWYRNHFAQVSGFKILDNGAAEGALFQPEELITIGWELGVDEIVIPDVLGDYQKTKDLVQQFARFMQRNPLPPGFNPGFMGVVQGKNVSELTACIRTYAMQPFITSIALPRILAKTLGDEFIRYHLTDPRTAFYNEIIKPRFEGNVHCLGATENPREVILLASHPVRGIDTSMVGAYSMAQKELRWDEYVPRQNDYFRGEYLDVELANRNHLTYLEWANYNYTERS